MDLQNGFPVSRDDATDKVSEKVKNDEIIKAMNTCCLCGTTLEFTHVTHHATGKVQEAAKCPACGIQTKVNSFSLQ